MLCSLRGAPDAAREATAPSGSLGVLGWRAGEGQTLRSPMSYPAICVVVSQGLLCSWRLDRGRVGTQLGAGRVPLTDGFEGAEEGTSVIRGVPCPRERGEMGSGQRHLHLVPPILGLHHPASPWGDHPGPVWREGTMTLGPQRRKTPGTGELGGVEERGKRADPPNPPPPQKVPGEGERGGGPGALRAASEGPRARPRATNARPNNVNPQQMLVGVEEAGAGSIRGVKLRQRSWLSLIRERGGSSRGGGRDRESWGGEMAPRLHL